MSIFFSFLEENICFWYSLEAPWLGTSDEYSQRKFLSRNKKTIYLIPTLISVLALTVKIRKSQDFLAPISGSPGDQIFSLTFSILKLNNT